MRTPSGYMITSYGGMVSCEPRMSAYAEATRQSLTPGCILIDIGALPARSPSFVAQTSQLIDHFRLALLDGEYSSGDIAQPVQTECPGRFANAAEAIIPLADLAGQYHDPGTEDPANGKEPIE